MDLNALSKEAHQISVEHGWWAPAPTFGELLALMHSELSEALEEYRAGRPMVWYKCNGTVCKGTECDTCDIADKTERKPEGIAVELADCIIRILDWCGHERKEIKLVPVARDCVQFKFGEIICECHWVLSKARENERHESVSEVYLNRCVSYILAWAMENELDMEPIIREKMAYNRTRPYRHGGKKL